jgi:hypothetical protein
MLDGKRAPATRRCNISLMRTASARCEAATRLELKARTISRGDHKYVGSDPFWKSSAAAAPIAFGQIEPTPSFLLDPFVHRARMLSNLKSPLDIQPDPFCLRR